MANKLYGSTGGLSNEVTKMYTSVGGLSDNVVKGYCSVGGLSKLFFGSGEAPYEDLFWFHYKTLGNAPLFTAKYSTSGTQTTITKSNTNGITFFSVFYVGDLGYNVYYPLLVSTDNNAVSLNGISNKYSGSITIDYDVWYYAIPNITFPNTYESDFNTFTPNCVLEGAGWSVSTQAKREIIVRALLARIYANDFAEDYQVGQRYNLVKADIKKTIRKFLAVYLYKMISYKDSYSAPYNAILGSIESIVDYLFKRKGNNDIIDLWADYNGSNSGFRLGAYYSSDSVNNTSIEYIDTENGGYTSIETDAYINYGSCAYIDFNGDGSVTYNNPSWTAEEIVYIGKGGYGDDYLHWSNVGLKFKSSSGTSDWIPKYWNGLSSFKSTFYGAYVWSDGDNIYYSYYFSSRGSDQYVLNRETNTWVEKTWNIPNMLGVYIWSDGTNIYYSDSYKYQYVLNKSTGTWDTKTWSGPVSQYFGISGIDVWTDGTNIYESTLTHQYVLNAGTNVWSNKTWNGLTRFEGRNVWTDGTNIYFSNDDNQQYILDKSTSTWNVMNWNGNTDQLIGNCIWTDGTNIYNSYYSNYQYVLDKSTNTWNRKTWTGFTDFTGNNIWKDGNNIYCSESNQKDYVLVK